jgi:folate-binding protein YgfZ
MPDLSEFHQTLGARFGELNGAEIVAGYGDVLKEHDFLTKSAGVFDLSFRSRICLGGKDRVRFLHGQVSNDVKKLRTGEGCYALLITAKGKIETDLNIWALENELLLDFEPGLAARVSERLERYIIADDVQIVDVREAYGMLTVQGPKAAEVIIRLQLFPQVPAEPFRFFKSVEPTIGETYLMNSPRTGSTGFDAFIPAAALPAVLDKAISAAREIGGGPCGWDALEIARIEASIPRFGADMDESNIALEAGIETKAISFSKGCYIGQEVISRVHTRGQVTKALRGLKFDSGTRELQHPDVPRKGDKLLREGKEVGYVTSATFSPRVNAVIALGYVRKECNQPGTELQAISADGALQGRIVDLPFAH